MKKWAGSGSPVNIGEPVTQQSGAAYTFAASDIGGYIQFTSGSAVTATIASDDNVTSKVSDVITFEQNGAGVVTVAAASGVTLNSAGSKVATNGQYAVASIKKVAANTWTLFGNLA